MQRIFVLIITLIPLSTSGETMVGGACTYENILGTARLAGITSEEKQFYFSPAGPVTANAVVGVSSTMRFTARQPTYVVSNDIAFPAALSVITEGSCTPYRFVLLSSEYFSHPIWIPFNKQGQLADAEKAQLRQLADIYQKIEHNWPKLAVNLCGITHREGTQEYNKELTNHYTQQIINILKSYHIDRERMYTSIATDGDCPGMNDITRDGGNGVNLSFHLTGPDRPSPR